MPATQSKLLNDEDCLICRMVLGFLTTPFAILLSAGTMIAI